MSQHINARLDRLEERIADQEQRDLVEEADERLERLVDQYVNDAKEDLEENTTYQVDAELPPYVGPSDSAAPSTSTPSTV